MWSFRVNIHLMAFSPNDALGRKTLILISRGRKALDGKLATFG